MCYQKGYVLQVTYLSWLIQHFLDGVICFLVSLAIVHWSGNCLSSSGCVPCDFICASACIFVCTCFCMNINSHDRMSNCVHDHTNNLFGRLKVWTPGLVAQSFCGYRVWAPTLAAQSFCGSRVQFPDPDHLFEARCILGLCHLLPWMEHQVAPQTKKTLSEVEKTCLHERLPLLYGEVERYLLVTKA